MIFDIPGSKKIEINTIILDLNGTLSVGGEIVAGTKERIEKLKENGFNIVLLTGNTRNDADQISESLGIDWKLATSAEDKRDEANKLGAENCASIGNGRIDLEMHKVVALSIVTLQSEGVHAETLMNSDIIVPNVNDALDLLIYEQRLIATLRC